MKVLVTGANSAVGRAILRAPRSHAPALLGIESHDAQRDERDDQTGERDSSDDQQLLHGRVVLWSSVSLTRPVQTTRTMPP